MAPPQRIRSLAPATAGYLAGLIDGEGTITLTRVHRTENRRLVVSISNNELRLLHFVKQAVRCRSDYGQENIQAVALPELYVSGFESAGA